jgi:hypothetical protein
MSNLINAADWIGGTLLLLAALYVGGRGLYAHRLESLAEKPKNQDRKAILRADARLLHAGTSLQRREVQMCVVVGAALQLAARLLEQLA